MRTLVALSILSVALGSSVRPQRPDPPTRIPLAHPLDRHVAPSGAPGLEQTISAAAHLCGVPEPILRELFRVESHFDHKAVSYAGAVGLGQLMPKTAEFMGVKNRKDPFENAVASACFLSSIKGETWRDRLLHYFAGNLPKTREAHDYADTILQGYDQ